MFELTNSKSEVFNLWILKSSIKQNLAAANETSLVGGLPDNARQLQFFSGSSDSSAASNTP